MIILLIDLAGDPTSVPEENFMNTVIFSAVSLHPEASL